MNESYTHGFAKRCAERGVDPHALVKSALAFPPAINRLPALRGMVADTTKSPGIRQRLMEILKSFSAGLRGGATQSMLRTGGGIQRLAGNASKEDVAAILHAAKRRHWMRVLRETPEALTDPSTGLFGKPRLAYRAGNAVGQGSVPAAFAAEASIPVAAYQHHEHTESLPEHLKMRAVNKLTGLPHWLSYK